MVSPLPVARWGPTAPTQAGGGRHVAGVRAPGRGGHHHGLNRGFPAAWQPQPGSNFSAGPSTGRGPPGLPPHLARCLPSLPSGGGPQLVPSSDQTRGGQSLQGGSTAPWGCLASARGPRLPRDPRSPGHRWEAAPQQTGTGDSRQSRLPSAWSLSQKH